MDAEYIDPDEFYDAQPERVPDAFAPWTQPILDLKRGRLRDIIKRGYTLSRAMRKIRPGPPPDIAAAYAEFAASGRKITKLPPARAEGAVKLDRNDGGLLMPSML